MQFEWEMRILMLESAYLYTSRNSSSHAWKKMKIKCLKNKKNHDLLLVSLIFLRDILINLFHSVLQINRDHELGIWSEIIYDEYHFVFSSSDVSHKNTKGEILLAFRSRSFLASGATDVEYIHESCHLNPRRLVSARIFTRLPTYRPWNMKLNSLGSFARL